MRKRRNGSRLEFVALALTLLLACGPKERSFDLLPQLSEGQWLPARGLETLTGVGTERGVSWRPLSARRISGWGRPSPDGWPLKGEEAVLGLRTEPGEELHLLLQRKGPQGLEVELRAAEELLQRIDLERWERSETQISLPRPLDRLSLRVAPPAGAGTELFLQRLGRLRSEDPVPDQRLPPVTAKSDPRTATLVLPEAGRWVAPVELPPGAIALRFSARFEGEEGALSVEAIDLHGERHRLGEISEGSARLPVNALAGRRILLSLQVAGRTAVVEPELLFTEVEETEPIAATIEGGNRPDVLFVILDAARGDRFLDYPRPVIPVISSLYDEALVFSRAYSECANTSCSTPHLLTGVSFSDLGSASQGKKLPDELTTLAEYLRPLGYRTVGFSANPNNSKAHNYHQGMDVFERTWDHQNPNHGPFGLSRLAEQIIAEQPSETPLFLMLHYLPPHQPYDPGPEFDLFTDPEYRGPIHPKLSLKPISRGFQSITDEDLHELIGAYDGNLRRVDAALGRVFDALRKAGRWQNTLVVVTADHGEAFLEHGYLSHNATLFEEMLHVPLILRLPGGEVPPEVDRDRLASVGDLVPTILARLGIETVPEVDGIDLLGLPPDERNPRVLFHRTHQAPHRLLAARTARWKAISREGMAEQYLFDLARDPEERNNLVLERPALFAGLGALLQQRLALAPAPSSEEVELSEEARRELEALGYLE